MAITAYGSEYLLPASLTNHQLDLINKIIAAVLAPVEELTQSISTDAASISLNIPFIWISDSRTSSLVL